MANRPGLPYTLQPKQPRDDATGRYARMPKDPEEVLKAGGTPDRWAPGLGNGSAPNKTGEIPWPEAKPPPAPFRNLQQGRK